MAQKDAIIVIYTHKDLNVKENEELHKSKFNGYKNRIELLINSLNNLRINFLSRFNYPIMIFCENYMESDKTYIRNKFKDLTISFEDIHPKIPDYLDEKEIMKNISRKPVVHWRNLGYRHMCKFYAIDVFKHPVISTYKYYMRVDDDSVIASPVATNIFDFMSFHNIDYMYRIQQRKDCGVCNEGMVDFFKSVNCDFNYNRDLVPFNNFHVIRLDAIKNKPILDNRTIVYNIYNKRWGDAPLHGAYIKMFNMKAECTESYTFVNFKYMKWGVEFPKDKMAIF